MLEDNTYDFTYNALPNDVGVGYKAQHFSHLKDGNEVITWLEIHAENYMGDGGRPLAQLKHLSGVYPISVHGVGLSIGGERPLDTDHLQRLKTLCDWLRPASFSEHLAWSSHDHGFLNNLLPLAYTSETLTRIIDHIDQVQTHLGRQMLLENPSSYLAFDESTFSESEFLSEILKQSGCGLLLDVNNIFVSAHNLDFDPKAYVDALPLAHVGEIHLGAHEAQCDSAGQTVLIDSHSAPVVDPMWDLYAYTLSKSGQKPTLIEWDNKIPEWSGLKAEAQRAKGVLCQEIMAI